MQTLQFVILFTLFLLTVWLFFLNSRVNHPSWAALEHRRYAHRVYATRHEQKLNTCLVYKSPSPRDTR